MYMADVKYRGTQLGFTTSSIKCFMKAGEEFVPEKIIIPPRTEPIICYMLPRFQMHILRSMSKCLGVPAITKTDAQLEKMFEMNNAQLKKAARIIASNKQGGGNTEDAMIPEQVTTRVVRMTVEPTTPLTRVAHWLKLKTTSRQSCHCQSGCHFCCVARAVSGLDVCFFLYCSRGNAGCRN